MSEAIGALQKIASGALAGAAFGSAAPGIGTAAGAAIGGTIALAETAIDAWTEQIKSS